MLGLVHLCLSLFFCSVSTIDRKEKIGLCIPGFDVKSNHYIHENEGVWFPQYRSHHPDNGKYTCHTLYEKMVYEYDEHFLQTDSYYTKLNKTIRTPYTQSYKQEKRGVLVDNDEIPDYGPYQVRNYIINLTPEYRVRYLCTDYEYTTIEGPTIYIETRSLPSTKAIIDRAVLDIKDAGFRVALDRISQHNCIRPLDKSGYKDRDNNSS
ncbi:Hypothetical protein NTJ_02361 [Nesidiocoris tenuis]|uniref:Lipocalin/cytosolic fatty-acid binding domain-containing protein n=1 Tax=Nesidiocoris tenuis TaxID=355587 RepID=A0ABN7ADW6_9HEMI|nr:Hypothetical protein NTJ_02361 [Nesidiocoris tenuis]